MQDGILKSEGIWKWFLAFFTKQISPKIFLIMVCQRNRRIHLVSSLFIRSWIFFKKRTLRQCPRFKSFPWYLMCLWWLEITKKEADTWGNWGKSASVYLAVTSYSPAVWLEFYWRASSLRIESRSSDQAHTRFTCGAAVSHFTPTMPKRVY